MTLGSFELKFRNRILKHMALVGDRSWTRFYKEQGEGKGPECIPILLTTLASYFHSSHCRKLRKPFNTWNIYQPECTELNPCICELEASGFPEITCTEMGKYGGRWYGDRAGVCASGQRENL